MNKNNKSKVVQNYSILIRDLYLKTEISKYITHIIISILLGLIAGLSAIFFHFLLEKMRFFFEPANFTRLFNVNDYFIILIPVIGGIISAAMTQFFPKVSREKGVLSVVKALVLNNGYIPLKVTLFHLFAPIVSIGTGAPLGPEGPVAKIGSGMGSFMSQLLKFNRDDMVMYTTAGAGAAISAVFNAPIAGVFFGIEVMLLNDLKNRALSALVISSVVADILSRYLIGNNQLFKIPLGYHLDMTREFPFFLLLGMLCGIVCIVYFSLKNLFDKIFNEKFKIKNNFLKLIPVTIIFGIILVKYYHLFGIGYNTINEVLFKKIPFVDVIILFALKLVFVALFLKAGSYGGTFAPSLSIGAFFGFSFASILNILFNLSLDPVTFSLVGMGGILAGLNSVPLTAIMLVFEVTNDYQFILPLMLVSIISYLVTIYYNKGNVYINELLSLGLDLTKKGEIDLLGKIKVKELIREDFESINLKEPFTKVYHEIMNSKYGDLFVVNDKNELTGIITLKEIRYAIINNDLVDLVIAEDLAMQVAAIKLDDPISAAIKKIEKYDIEIIPVVKNEKSNIIIGLLTHQDIIQAYNTQLKEWKTDQFLVDYSTN